MTNIKFLFISTCLYSLVAQAPAGAQSVQFLDGAGLPIQNSGFICNGASGITVTQNSCNPASGSTIAITGIDLNTATVGKNAELDGDRLVIRDSGAITVINSNGITSTKPTTANPLLNTSVSLTADNGLRIFGPTSDTIPVASIDETTGDIFTRGSATVEDGLTIGVVTPGAKFDTRTTIDQDGNVGVGGNFKINNPDVTVDMGGNRIQNVGAPVAATDAANRAYVDERDGFLAGSIADANERIVAANARIDSANRRIDDVEEGVAMALAIQNPDLIGSEKFGISVNWGNFEGANAFGVAAMGVIGKDIFGAGERTAITGGFGYGSEQGTVGGRAGVQFTW
ncbi:MAG: hypothetical protein NW215_15515 [Hyphomicrobiales bacterium]|nr:hypothetical protein [Hyphomicrobiales bacterium]